MNKITRRHFLSGAATGALGIAAMGILGAASAEEDAGLDYASLVQETLEADIVVVGAGNSGLAAALQAGQLGNRVVVLETNAMVGANTEGLFAVGSHYQQAQGIDITMREIIAKEQVFFNYRVNALYWKDMIENSADNLAWLEENGVLFSGQVDNYYSLGRIPVFHWFVDGAGSNLTHPMEAKAQELGVEFRFETRGRELIMEDGAVSGIYAELSDGGILEIRAKSVILATGGFINNLEMMAQNGIQESDVRGFIQGRRGDGIQMACRVGSEDRTNKTCYLREASFIGKGWLGALPDWVIYSGKAIWVNEDGERFTNELCSRETSGCVTNAHYTQKAVFGLFGQSALDTADETVKAAVEDALASGSGLFCKADTLEEIAAFMGADAAILQENVERYNVLCEKGLDEDFDKSAEALVTMEAPYYAGLFSGFHMQTIGGLRTSRSAEVLTGTAEPVPGLYAVGTDGCMLYGETYTISVPASCNGNNINSGRTAAKAAAGYIAAL